MPPAGHKSVLIAAPHTSNWDLPYTLMVAFALRLQIYWMGKSSIFSFPFGPIMRWLGGIAVNRSQASNLVDSCAQELVKAEGAVHLVVPPEGTRSKTRYWKTGFYYIALQAQVPIVMAYMDYSRKVSGLGPLFYPSGDIDKDMVALPIGPRLRMATAGTPGYFAAHGMPKVPGDLTGHRCINIRLPTSGGLYVWEYEKKGREINVRVDGPLVFSTSPHMVDAALDGLGLVHLPVDELAPHLESGRLVRVLEDWCPLFPGYHLYYPSRRQPSPAFSLVLEALRV